MLATDRRRARPEVDLHRAGEQGLGHGLAGRAGDLGPARHELLEERRLGVLAEIDDRPGEERPIRRTDQPSGGRSAARAGRRPGRAGRTPWLQSARASWANLSLAGQRRRRPRSAARVPSGSRASAAAERLERRRPRPRRPRTAPGRPRRPRAARSGRRHRPARRPDPSRRRCCWPPPSGRTGLTVISSAGAQVDVRRVEPVRLDRQAPRTRPQAASRSARSQSGSRSLGGERLDEARSGKVNGRSADAASRRAAPVRGTRTGRGGALDRHPSDPSISSFTSRLNSIAYSIGSSLVKTSRKPWTIRFWASFSVRPRLIR